MSHFTVPLAVAETADAGDVRMQERAIERALLIVSPVARRGRHAAAQAERVLQQHGVAYTIVETQAPRHATTIASERALDGEFDAVFAVGGDGTAMEILTAFANQPNAPAVGIVPAGTANVLARTLRIPMQPGSAAQALLGGDVATIDLGRMGDGRRFAIGLGVGLDAAMIAGAGTGMKRRLGYLAYMLSGAMAGLRLPVFHVRLTVDGVVHELDTSSLLIANFGTVLGGRICFGGEIRHDDGLLHACLYSPRGYLDAARILWRMLRGSVATDRCYRGISGREFRIEMDPARNVQADGELLGTTPIDITIEPRAARLLVPPARASVTESQAQLVSR